MKDLAVAALRLLPPETAHRVTVELAARFAPFLLPARKDDPRLGVEAFGLHFPNPIGVAAGFDKNARAFRAMFKMGFGYAECGTVTPLPQDGNPRPRLYRLREDGAVVNRMGFDNDGMERVAERLLRRGKGIVRSTTGRATTPRAPRRPSRISTARRRYRPGACARDRAILRWAARTVQKARFPRPPKNPFAWAMRAAARLRKAAAREASPGHRTRR